MSDVFLIFFVKQVFLLCSLFVVGTHAILDSIVGFLNGGLPNVYGEEGDSWYFSRPNLGSEAMYDQVPRRQKRAPQYNGQGMPDYSNHRMPDYSNYKMPDPTSTGMSNPTDTELPNLANSGLMDPVRFFSQLVKAKIIILTATRALQAVGYEVQTNRDGVPIVPTNPGIGQRVFMAVKAALDNLGPSTIEYRLRQGLGALLTNVAFDAARDILVSAGFDEATIEYYRGDVRFVLQTALNVAAIKLFKYVQKLQIPVEAAKLLVIAGKSFVPIVDTAAAAVANPLIQAATH